jgi:hypothetical protein
MTLKLGNTSKNSRYLRAITGAIQGDFAHPRKHGVQMQAHHIVSADGMKKSGRSKQIRKFGYDINHKKNLAFIPCTLQGACHLRIQPHRGNHDGFIDQNDYTDDMEPETYHELVARKIRNLDLPLAKECPGSHASKVEKVIVELNKLSADILDLIQNKPLRAPLTRIAAHFGPTGVGCSGVDSVGKHSGTRRCAANRNHFHNPESSVPAQAPGQKEENITFKVNGQYRLRVGR